MYPKHARYQATLRPDYQAVNSAPAPGVWQTILESELFHAGVADLDVVAAAAEFLEADVAFERTLFHGNHVFAVMALEGGLDGMQVGVHDCFAIEDDFR